MDTITARYAVDNDALTEIHNVLEALVMQEIQQLWTHRSEGNSGYWADIACLALNQLPAHYIRHAVDYASNLSDRERHQRVVEVRMAVSRAREIAERRRSGERD